MNKPAETNYPIHELLRQRWSPRAFADRPVEREKIHSLLEAIRWAPSSFNEQPWAFLIATKTNRVEYDRLLSCLIEFNQGWAKTAPVLMLSLARLKFTHNNKPNRHALHDVGLATENLALQAMALGLFIHPMAGFDAAQARTLFAIPEDCETVAAIALGYPGETGSLSTDLQQRELAARERKPLSDFIFADRWGQVSGLINGE